MWQQLAGFELNTITAKSEKARLPKQVNTPINHAQGEVIPNDQRVAIDEETEPLQQLQDNEIEDDNQSVESEDAPPLPTTRSGRVIRRPQRYDDYVCYDSHRSVSCIGIGLPLRD
jgi:hypothetical protein